MKVLGVWYGFDSKIPLRREGISRYVLFLVDGLLRCTDIRVEIWCYACNLEELLDLFSEVTGNSQYGQRLTFHTEVDSSESIRNDSAVKNDVPVQRPLDDRISYKLFNESVGRKSKLLWQVLFFLVAARFFASSIFHFLKARKIVAIGILFLSLFVLGVIPPVYFKIFTLLGCAFYLYRRRTKIFSSFYMHYGDRQLAQKANSESKADLFLVPYVGLYNSLSLNKKLVVAIHDLVAISHFRDFIDMGSYYWALLQSNLTVLIRTSQMVDKASYFVSNSEYVMKEHALGFIRGVSPKKCTYVYLPVQAPDIASLSAQNIAAHYGLTKPYLFYPTQARPYKNIETLLKALRLLVDDGFDLQVGLTASNIYHNQRLHSMLQDDFYKGRVIVTGDVTNTDLFLLHKGAVASVVATKFEGGMPWQGVEALSVGTPTIMSDIPQTVERLNFAGLDSDNCSIPLFDVNDESQLAEQIKQVIADRDAFVVRQKSDAEKILAYTWDDTARDYFKVFEKVSRST